VTDPPRDTGIARPRASPNSPRPRGPSLGRPRALGPLAIALLYAAVGAAWIFLSDRALTLLFPAGEVQRWQTVKGLLYVAVTAVLLYLLTRQSLAAVRRSERLYRQMFETTTVALLLDPDSARIEDANAAACAFYGWTRDELIGRPLTELNTLPRPEIESAIERALAGQRGHFVFQHRVRDGSLRDVEVFSSVVDVAGRRLLYSVIYDRTEARRLEEQLRQAQKLETLGQLTGGIAHDLNNVLSVVLGNAELLSQELPPERADLRSDLGELTSAARRGAAMIRKLLTFSRSAPLEVVTLDLAAAVGETATTLQRFISAAIEVTINVPREPLRVRADRGSIEQILMNLVTNARDAMPSGGHLQIEVRRRVATDEDGGADAASGSLIVRDDGVGMDEMTRSRIFEPFFTTKPPPVGTGLGMTMIQALVRQQGASIAVESAPGRGTTVTITFPLAAEPVRAVESVAESPGLPRGTETILVVEDEAPLRRAAARLVERLGYRVLTASDGAEALAILQREGAAIQLVLSDIVMPRMGGRALHDALRREGSMVKFLFTSGYGGENLEEGGRGEVPVLIRKPWSLSELAVKLREVLDA
jgi:two-component system, cell cycle sensor histidine kinase and response regulator CckA